MTNEKTTPEFCRSISPTFPNPMCMGKAEHDDAHYAVDKNGNPWPDWTVSKEVKPGLSEGDRVVVVCEPQASGGAFAGEWTVVIPAWAGSQFLAVIEHVDGGQQAKFYEDGLQKVGADQ